VFLLLNSRFQGPSPVGFPFRMNSLLLGFALVLFPLAGFSHGILLEKDSKVLGVRALDESGSPLRGETVLVYSSDEESVPAWKGKTDDDGRFSFSPDRAGKWQVVVADGIGHRAELVLEEGAVPFPAPPDRYARVLAGVGFLFGVFGLWVLFRRRVG
jgi:nickel transport protein